MSDKLNLSLDDIIKQNKQKKIKGGKKSSFAGSRRNFPKFKKNKFSHGFKENKEESNFKRWDKYNKGRRHYNHSYNQNKDSRLRISNLHYNVMNNDLYSLFSSVGKLRRCGIHWDEAGISKGTADVEYENPSDAQRAMDNLNGTELEGMKIIVEFL